MFRKFALLTILVLTEYAIYKAATAITSQIPPTYVDSIAFMDMLTPILIGIVIVLSALSLYLTVLLLVHAMMFIFPSLNKRGVM